MIRRPPISTRTYTHFPYTTLFRSKRSVPYGLVLESIGKISSHVPFIMPKRVAETDAFEQIKDYTGSGPFKFEAAEWRPGAKVVYTKFAEYVPRSEPPSAAAGGKVAHVEIGRAHV